MMVRPCDRTPANNSCNKYSCKVIPWSLCDQIIQTTKSIIPLLDRRTAKSVLWSATLLPPANENSHFLQQIYTVFWDKTIPTTNCNCGPLSSYTSAVYWVWVSNAIWYFGTVFLYCLAPAFSWKINLGKHVWVIHSSKTTSKVQH